MGTHMWSGGASRRGRRMSLELPPRPLHEPHDLLRRPDLFYPYLPAPFLNGMQQKVRAITRILDVYVLYSMTSLKLMQQNVPAHF